VLRWFVHSVALCAPLQQRRRCRKICRYLNLFQIESQIFEIKSRSFKSNLYTSNRIAKRVQIAIGICPSLVRRLYILHISVHFTNDKFTSCQNYFSSHFDLQLTEYDDFTVRVISVIENITGRDSRATRGGRGE